MKKLIILLIVCVGLLLSACSNNATTEAITPSPQPTEELVISTIRISELMASNKSSYPGPMSSYPDWIELVNIGSENQSLLGLSLQRGSKSYNLPDISLEVGERLLLLCSDSDVDGMYNTGFKLSKEGFQIKLLQNELPIQELSIPAMDADISCLVDENNVITLSDYPSPGFASYEDYQAQLECYSPLMISEVMVYNRSYPAAYNEYYDWVELKNNSAYSIKLSDYYLSDKSTDLKRFRLPDVTLASGEYTVIYLDELCTDGSKAPFQLSAERDELYVSNEAASKLDAVLLRDIPYGGSFGRMDGENGFFFFTSPSPMMPNTNGVRSISQKPVLLNSDGVFNNVDSVLVELEGSNLYYTLDGSMPTEKSTPYTAPFSVSETCVVRVVSIEKDKLPSQPLNLSYIINEKHTLPVMSITADPEEMLGNNGIYKNPALDLRTAGAAMFYEEDSNFSINCEIALHGATSKMAQSKKSFNLYFKSALDGTLKYDLFENGITEYSKVILRADQESRSSSLMRDNLMHQLAIKSFPALSAQDYKFCVLYINGEYWGVYNLREAHGETHFAQHHGIDEELVSHYKEEWTGSEFDEYYKFIINNDMTIDENYQYAAEHVDIDSLIAWAIIQAYSGNIDLNPPNSRFYYRYDEQKLYYALVDLDLGMNDFYAFPVPYSNYYAYNSLFFNISQNKNFQMQLAEELSRVVHSTMADENVVALIDSLAAEIRPEMERNGQRWEMKLNDWEDELAHVRWYVGGRAKFLVGSFRETFPISKDDFNRLFGDFYE